MIILFLKLLFVEGSYGIGEIWHLQRSLASAVWQQEAESEHDPPAEEQVSIRTSKGFIEIKHHVFYLKSLFKVQMYVDYIRVFTTYSLRLPECVNHRTPALAHGIVEPVPRLWVDGLTNRTQDLQAGQVVPGNKQRSSLRDLTVFSDIFIFKTNINNCNSFLLIIIVIFFHNTD